MLAIVCRTSTVSIDSKLHERAGDKLEFCFRATRCLFERVWSWLFTCIFGLLTDALHSFGVCTVVMVVHKCTLNRVLLAPRSRVLGLLIKAWFAVLHLKRLIIALCAFNHIGLACVVPHSVSA